MSATFSRFIDELNRAGYDGQDYVRAYMVVDCDDHFAFLVDDDNGGYLVGAFYKGTLVSSGEFRYAPMWEGEDLLDGLEFLKHSV